MLPPRYMADVYAESFVVMGKPEVPHPQNSKEIPLFVHCWPAMPAAHSNRALLILHGLGEHGGRYQHLPSYLGEAFDCFYAMDQRGHGRSGGLRGDTPSLDHLAADLKKVALEVAHREKGKSLYLLAHSFGGLVALYSILKDQSLPFAGLIISAPLLGVAMKVPAYKKFLGEVLGRVLGRLQLTNEINPSHLSHDASVIEAYVHDRLVHAKITPRLYLSMCSGMEWVKGQTGPLKYPLLFIVPGDDRVVDAEASIGFFRALKSRDKEWREYPAFYHEALNEIGKEKVFEDIKKWLH